MILASFMTGIVVPAQTALGIDLAQSMRDGSGRCRNLGKAMKILFFGRLAEQLGSQLEINPPGNDWTVAELRDILSSRGAIFAEALHQPGIKACVDQVVVPEETPVRRGQEVAFIPLLSGG